ncbi:hypothetical protein [Methylotenera versatilis]|uniref:hypothetical protein n=1 Tax=Methylotenera versatilis TaxID=1055487 RepID=UPI001EE67FA4|nr:hypothetical protein [Methylotenera versatilis]
MFPSRPYLQLATLSIIDRLAHPSVVKRIIDVGSTDHVNVDMAFRCEAANMADCDKLLSEFKEVNKLIYKVYEKKFITSADGVAVREGVESLE